MQQGPIEVRPRVRLDDRSARILSLWEKHASTGTPPTPPWGAVGAVDALAPADWQTVLQGAGSVVAACTSRHPAWMRDAVGWCARAAGPRTYLFGPEAWVSSPGFQAVVKAGAARLLTRLGDEPPADFLVADRERGWLVLGAPGEARRWVLPLEPSLARGLHEAFVHLFWHRARRESSPGGRLRDCAPAPFAAPGGDTWPISRGQLVTRAARSEPLLPDAELLVEPGVAPGEPPETPPGQGSPRLLLRPPGRDGHAALTGWNDRGTQVAWFDGGLPRLALTRRRMVMELGEGPERLRLEFEAEEAIRMGHLLELGAEHGAWRFHPRRALRDVRGPVLLEGMAAEQHVRDELKIELEDMRAAELLALDTVEPAAWREPSELARCLRYQWRVLPPVAPAGARPARLLREWEQLDTQVEARASTAVAHLEREEEEERKRGLLARLTGLLSSWKTVGSRRRRLRIALDEVREQALSRRPAEAPKLVAQLEAQEKELTELVRFCREQEDQEELRVAEEAQRAAHARQREQALQEREQARLAWEEVGSRLQEKRDALPPMETRLQARTEELLRAAYEERTARVRQKLAEGQTRLESLKQQQAQLQTEADAAGKEDSKRLKKELHKQKEAAKRLEGELEQHRRMAELPFQPGAERPPPDEEWRRLEEPLRAARQELAALEQDEKRRRTELDTHTQALDKPFQFQPPALPARPGRKPESSPRPMVIPQEPPPELGALLEHGERRYLAVRTWEEAARAKAEADRLGAMLVAGGSGLTSV